MEVFKFENVNFTYPKSEQKALDGIGLTVRQGEFVTLCGNSGCGKTTLLRLLKPALAPFGRQTGRILFQNKPLAECDKKTQAAEIGFVLQNPENQIVTDKVWHELAFGLESLGLSTAEIRTRVSEMASFFGIQSWFHEKTADLSGGQKQILNLASVMVMQPSVLLLDEPTGQLDPIAAQNLLQMVSRINRELGTSVVLSEHRLEEALPLSDRVVVMDNGKIIADAAPHQVGQILKDMHHFMYHAMPVPVQIHGAVQNALPCPLTVREGRDWLLAYAKEHTICGENIPCAKPKRATNEPIISVQNACFRYEKNKEDVIKSLNLEVQKGELLAIVGGNGTGKTTALSLLCGLNRPYRGKVLLNGKPLSAVQKQLHAIMGVLPQNPQSLFVQKTVYADLAETASGSLREKQEQVEKMANLCRIAHLLQQHPYDLSGGEQQRVALAKILLKNPQILLLDEPTKGMDAQFKAEFANLVKDRQAQGVTVIMVSHDIEFCALYADRCAMFFDGGITAAEDPRTFFAGKTFYTTAANRMAGTLLPKAVLPQDVILACGGVLPSQNTQKPPAQTPKGLTQAEALPMQPPKPRKKNWLLALLFLALGFGTVFAGSCFLQNRKYYFISLLLILETLLFFGFSFEKHKPQAREVVLISVLCAIAVAGRAAFFMLPQFKPVLALVIISGISLGGETGFLVGAVTGFVSNFFFGQGPWTPWQMFAFGIVGLLSGICFSKKRPKKIVFCLFGFLASICLYGGVMNLASLLIGQGRVTRAALLSVYALGLPYDCVHAAATAFFLWILGEPMLDKIKRIQIKYGFMQAKI